ncbi:MAG TPA: gamma-glutamyltransferase [Acidimicrobiales bacterium]|nr:gamma-glutamyltransferase [Acidimicrobiales bacterium]
MDADFTTRPTLRGTFAMVSSTHWLASGAAMSVLEAGGNAFDAAVAAGLVLQVVEPHLNGPGGEVPAIVSIAGNPRPRVLAGQGPAPAAATAAHFEGLGFELVPGAGLLAATVPGAFDAWLVLLRDHGSFDLRDVARYAIEYAGGGHPLGARVAATVAAVEDLFRTQWTTSAELWLPGGSPPRAGDRFVNAAWAAALERLVREGESAGHDRESRIDATRRSWREGFVADAIDSFARRAFQDSSGERHPGVITGEDLARFACGWEDPLVLDWHGYCVAKTGPWGQGAVLLQSLAILDALVGPEVPDPGTEEGAHIVAECLKLALADREAWYGDSGDVPIMALLSSSYAGERARLVGERASLELRPGSPDGRVPRLARRALASFLAASASPSYVAELPGTAGEPTVDRSGATRGDTVHVDVVDRWGNMVSATPSGGWLQSSPAIPGLGFCLGTRLQMTWLEQGVASSLVPGRRPRTTLSPTLVTRDGDAVLACGTPGGDQQDQWQLLFLLRHLGAGVAIQDAIDSPALHTESFPSSFHPRLAEPGSLYVEDRIGEGILRGLERRGHRVHRAGEWSLGRLCAVGRDPRSAVLSAGANPRGMTGYAAGR